MNKRNLRWDQKILTVIAAVCIALLINLPAVTALSITHSVGSDIVVNRNTAQISWETDEPSTTNLEWGLTKGLGTEDKDTTNVLIHSVNLLDLQFDTRYYYKLTSVAADGEIAAEDNIGNMYSFTTQKETDVPTEDTEAPTIEAEVPRYWHRDKISISGTTDPHAWVSAYVNAAPEAIGGMSEYITKADETGRFTVPNIRIQQSNVIVLYAKDTGGNTGTAEFQVDLDLEAPVIEFELPNFAESQSMQVSGTASEDVTAHITIGEETKDQEITKGQFTITLNLKSEGDNTVGVIFEDKGGNTVVVSKDLSVDTTQLTFVSHNLDALTPSYVQEVKVKGKVSRPGATVVAFVNGETTDSGEWSTDLRDNVVHFGTVGTGIQSGEYTAAANENGDFEINIFLSKTLSSSQRQYPSNNLGQQSGDIALPPNGQDAYGTSPTGQGNVLYNIQEQVPNLVKLVAIDENGQTAETEATINFASCGVGGDWNVELGTVTPSIITPALLKRGLAQLGFTVSLKWNGISNADTAKITASPSVHVTPISEAEQERYILNPRQAIGNNIQSIFDPNGFQDGSVVVSMNKQDYIQDDLDKLELKEDLTVYIPLQMEINYEYEQFGVKQHAVQRHCWDIYTVLDVELPPDEVIPEKLLNTSIKFLNETVHIIDSILEPLETITIITFGTCVASGVVFFIQLAREKLACLQGEEKTACKTAKLTTKKVEVGLHWVCDRIFCPAAPMIDKYIEDKKGNDQTDACDNPVSLDSLKDAPPGFTINPNDLDGTSGDCGREYLLEWDSSCVGINELKKSKCIIGEATNDPVLMKQGCDDFATKTFYSSTDICEKDAVVEDRKMGVTENGQQKYYCINEDHSVTSAEKTEDNLGTLNEKRDYECSKSNSLVDLGNDIDTDKCKGCKTDTVVKADKDGLYYFGEEDDKKYLTFNDNSKKWETTERIEDTKNFPPNKNPKKLNSAVNNARNLPQTDREYAVDPTSGFISAMSCGCLPAVSGYLTLWRNIFGAVQQCLQTVVITGDGSAGACKAVLTTYVCDLMIDAVRCAANTFGAGESRSNKNDAAGFIGALTDAGKGVKESIVGRYGSSSIFKTMFVDKELIHAACLYAFTGKFDFDIGGALSGSGAIPLESEGFLHPNERRFITSNPVNHGYATYVYHFGAGLIAGSEMQYNLQLICSADNSCDPDDGFVNGQCDCMGQGEKIHGITQSFGPGRLGAGEMLGPSEGDIYVQIVDHPVRYDKVRLSWDYKDNENKPAHGEIVKKISQAGDKPPVDCNFDILAAPPSFHCNFVIGQKGYLRFVSNPIAENSKYNIGDQVKITANLEKMSPGHGAANAEIIPFLIKYETKLNNNVLTLENSFGKEIIAQEGQNSLLISFNLNKDKLGRKIQKIEYPPLSDGKGGALPQLQATFIINANNKINYALLATKEEGSNNICYALFNVEKEELTKKISYVLKNQIPIQAITPPTFPPIPAPTICSRANDMIGPTIVTWERYAYDSAKRIEYNGGTITISFPDSLSESKIEGTAITYTPSDPEILTREDREYSTEITLYHCRENKQGETTVQDCTTTGTPVNYNGEVQRRTVTFTVSYGEKNEQQECPPNTALAKNCICGGETCGNNKYCYFEPGTGTPNDNEKCVDYKACPQSSVVITETTGVKIGNRIFCGCNDFTMEDCTGKICNTNANPPKCETPPAPAQ